MQVLEFTDKVLNHPNGGVDALIDLAGGGEADWLEFKADLMPREGQYQKNENKADYQWNVAEAVIAMANSSGGVILLGVAEDEETKKPFPLGLLEMDPYF